MQDRNPGLEAPQLPELVHRALAGRTAEVERIVRQSYAAILEPQFACGLALAAVGGFGRGELFPHSDIDLMLLVDSGNRAPAPEVLAAFLRALQETGSRISYSMHTVEECIAAHLDNLELTISLLDRRMLAGDNALYELLDQRFRAFTTKCAGTIAKRLAALAEGRRAKYQNTIYHLEPNIKDAPGGLRDLQTARWLPMLRPVEGAPDLSAAFDFLAGVRIRMHELAGRDQSALSFDLQEALSAQPASLMSGYFRYTRLVDRSLSQSLEAAAEKHANMLGRFHEWRSRLSNSDFTVSRDRVLLRSHQIPRGLSLFEFVARHGLRLAPDTVRRLHGFIPETNWEDWKRLLTLPLASMGLRAMEESGVLAAALPEWRNIEYLVVRDFVHRYTVDEQTLAALASLESITDSRFKEMFREIGRPAVLRLAILFNGMGIGSGPDPTKASLDIARATLGRLGAPEEDRAAVEFLIQRQLDLSGAMNSRDLHDGSTARTLAERVGAIDRLKMLVILTYADTSATNPQAMTPWRAEQLWRVYELVREELTRKLGSAPARDAGWVPPDRARFLEGLPARYLRLHSQEEIGSHFELAQQLPSQPLALEIWHERGYYRLTLLTRDRPRLFASVAGAISSFGLNILKADAFSNASGVVVDTFTFSDPHRTLDLHPAEIDRLRGVMKRVVEGTQDVDHLLSGRPKPFRSTVAQLKPLVSIKNEASEKTTLIEIVAEDRPGLLYDLASAISRAGCDIDVVLIDTEARKARDVFYVTSQGSKLDDAQETRLKADLLAACLGQPLA